MPQDDPKSSSGQEQQQTFQTNPYPYSYPQHSVEDTFDLYEIGIVLWKRKWLVIALTVILALVSIVYALQLPRVYKAEALLLPPKAKDFQSINVLGVKESVIKETGIKMTKVLDSEEVFKLFLQNLKSRSIQRSFIQQFGLMELMAPKRTQETRDEDIYQRFAGIISVVEENQIATISIELFDAEMAAQWVNDYVEFVDKETVAMLIEDLQNLIENKAREVEYNISSKRQMAERRRKDQIIRYIENAEIAKKLGMLGRVDATNIIQTTQNADISTATTPLYYHGYEALMTEIQILRTRRSDDPFIPGLRDLQEHHAMLRSINIDQKSMGAVHVDQAAYPSKLPIRPNRKKIVSFATVVGFFSGIFLTFLIEYVQNLRKKRLV